MGNNKKITFEGVDNGILSLMEKYKKTAEDTYGHLVRDAKELNKASSEQIKIIQQRIKELEKENNLKLESTRLELRTQYERLSRNATPNQRAGLANDMSSLMSSAMSEHRGEATLLGLVKGIFDEMKKADADAKQRDNEDKKLKQEQITQINDQWEARRSLWDQELNEDPDGVNQRIKGAKTNWFERAFMGRRDYDGMSEYEREKLGYQENNRKDDGEKKQESLFGALLKIETLKAVARSVTGVVTSLSNAGSGDQLVNQMIGNIPFIGPMLSAPRTRMVDEQFNAQVPYNKLKGRMGNANMFSVEGAGFSIAETMPIADQVALAKGSKNNNEKDTINSILLERAFSIDRSVLTQTFSASRLTKSPSDIVQDVAVIMNSIPGLRNDRTQLQEILQLQNTLITQQSSIVEKVNPAAVSQSIAAFRNVGGSFADARAGERIATMNNALSNPSNDFQKARNFGVLSKLKPGGSYFSMLEDQEQGINTPGFLSETLEQLQNEYGGGDAFRLAIKQRFGLSASSSRTLGDAYTKNKGVFNGITGTVTDKMKELGIDLPGTAGANTSEREIENARISNAFVEGVTPGLKMAGRLMAGDFIETLKETKIDMGPFDMKFGWAATIMSRLFPNAE